MSRLPLLRRGLLPAALVLSGFAALSVEVLWQRLLSRVLGGSTTAVTAVLIAYMGGLALGAGLAGRRGDRLSPARALSSYVWLEVAVWAAASFITLLLGALPVGIGGTLAALPEGGMRFLARFAIASALLLLPTTAMGATLPLAVRAAVGGSDQGLLRGTGVLYAANTAGAVLGALVAPLVLLPLLGVRVAALVGAAGSLLAALVARWAEPAREPEPESVSMPAGASPPSDPIVWVALASLATGGAALGFEVVWTRSLATLAGSSVHAFGLVLALVLGGLALGSAAVSAASRRIPQPAAVCAVLSILGPTLAVVLLRLLDGIPARFFRLAEAGNLTLESSLTVLLAVGAAAILPPTLCFGAALPLAVRAARSRERGSADAVGRIYIANTLGALAGAAVTGLLLIPAVGQARAAVLVAAGPVAAGMALLIADPGGPRRQRVVAVAFGAAAGVAIAVAPSPSPYAAAAAAHKPRGAVTVGHVVYYAEGPEAPVLVEAVGAHRTFYVGGRPEASDLWLDVRNQYLLGHLPALLAGGARRSLVIGLGSGMTAGSLTEYGEVTIAELNRAVPGAARQFGDLNRDVLARANLRIEDGRVLLAQPGTRFEVITTDPIHPYVAGSAALYTTEHLRLCRDRLTVEGAVSLWVPLHQMGMRELKAMVGSFVDVFPDAELYLSYYNAILVGGGRRGSLTDRLTLLREGWSESVAADMRRVLIASPEELAAERVAGPEELRRFVAGARRNLDDDPWIEVSLPTFIYRNTVTDNVEALLALRPAAEAASPLARAYDAAQRSYLLSADRALAMLRATLVNGRSPLLEHAARTREVSAQLGGDLLRAGRREQAVALARAEVAHAEATIDSLLTAADVLRAAGDWTSVDAANARLIRQWPDRLEGHLRAGQALFEQARFVEAIPHLERAVAVDRFLGEAWRALGLLGRAHLMTGEINLGRSVLRRSLALRADQPDVELLLHGSPEVLAEVRRSLEFEAARRAPGAR